MRLRATRLLTLNGWGRILIAAALAAAIFAIAAPGAFAQSCAMCYQTAAGAPAKTQNALRHGILVLLFPPMAIFAGLIGLLYQRRDQTRGAAS